MQGSCSPVQTLCWSRPSCWSLPSAPGAPGDGSHHPSTFVSPTDCRELLLQAAVPLLQDLVEKGEEEEACIELLSSILEVLYQAQKVNPIPSAPPFPLQSSPCSDLKNPFEKG